MRNLSFFIRTPNKKSEKGYNCVVAAAIIISIYFKINRTNTDFSVFFYCFIVLVTGRFLLVKFAICSLVFLS